METKIASRVLCGILLTIVLFVSQACLGSDKKEAIPGDNKTNKIQNNFFTPVVQPFLGATQYVQNSWTYKISAFVLATALRSVCSVAQRYQVPLLAGTAAGIATYAGCSYFGIRQRSFFAGAAFAGVTSVVAWFFYQIEVKKDLQEIKERLKAVQAKLEVLANETADKVSVKLEPWFNSILRSLNEKFNTLSKQVDKIESGLKKHFDPQFKKLSEANKKLIDDVKKLQKQLSDFEQNNKKLNKEQTESITRTIASQFANYFSLQKDILVSEKQANFWDNFKKFFSTELNPVNIK
ncbi:MAG: hypothetical protein UV38_C0003G0230 [candidate division TM6 bacterium GW2011_GWE2_42_60]|nr:MAG: hypothetical protein UV38_C0003G0230 [candidate division TM6 bacterium GW2011_GWE2_42_60]